MFFILGTVLCFGAFALLTVDTIRRVPAQTRFDTISESAIRGKHLFDRKNCMGCHTILGEGGYYAPELTKVYERRGPQFIKAMLEDPEKLYPGQRKMVAYKELTEQDREDFVAFFKWIGEMDLNGFPPKPKLAQVSVPSEPGTSSVPQGQTRPKVFDQMCLACHAIGGQGGNVGPALDKVGAKMNQDEFKTWLTDPNSVRPGTLMPKLPLTPEQIAELSAYLTELK